MAARSGDTKPKKIKLATGTVYQKEPAGTFYFRYQLGGFRKAVSLKTKVEKDAIQKAEELLPMVKATSAEVVSAHVNELRGWGAKEKKLLLCNAWEYYSTHPDRATPATVHEQLSYQATWGEFIQFIGPEYRHVREITVKLADSFAQYLRQTAISVSTHNRKIKRIRKIFSTMSDFVAENPFQVTLLRRKPREEQEQLVRRLPFSREQEQKLLEVLDDPKHKVINKAEIKVIYYLGMFTGQRLKDCVLLKWDKVDLKRRRINVKQFKTGKEVVIPIADDLFAELNHALTWQTNDYVCPKTAERYKKTDSRGKAIGDNLVNTDILRVIRWTGVEPSVAMEGRKRKVTVYGFHSLRHSFASHCAEAGVPKAVLLSILGTDSEIADKYYTHIGEDAQEKAIAAITSSTTSLSPQARIDRTLKYLRADDSIPLDIKQKIEKLLS